MIRFVCGFVLGAVSGAILAVLLSPEDADPIPKPNTN